MPDGVTHFKVGIIVGTLAVVGWQLWLPDENTTRQVLVGTAIGLFVTPDLDQEGTTFTERLLRRIPVIGWLWQSAFYPYALLTRHRGISHALLLDSWLPLFMLTTWVGTMTRLFWCLVLIATCSFFVIGMVWLGGGNPGAVLPLTVRFADWLLAPVLLLAWAWQDFWHVAMDWVHSG